MGQAAVVQDRLGQHQAGAFAVLGDQGDAGLDRLADMTAANGAAVDLDGAGNRAPDPEDGLDELAASRADQPTEAEDLALVDVEVYGRAAVM